MKFVIILLYVTHKFKYKNKKSNKIVFISNTKIKLPI